VLTVHLIAPYAKIVISATPAVSEIADDPASNVVPPEMMHALDYRTGDCGVVQNLAIANAQCGTTSPGPAPAIWDDNPCSSPLPRASTAGGSSG
jgi:hypothetical protein